MTFETDGCSPDEKITGNDLFDLARNGDVAAMNELLSVLRPQLRALANRANSAQLARRVDCSDLVQETLLEAYQSLGADFRGQTEAELHRWLQRILRTKHIDALRRHVLASRRSLNHEVSIELPSTNNERKGSSHPIAEWSTPSETVMRDERDQQLYAALNQLGTDQAEAIRLVYFENLPLEEVRLRMSKPTTNAVTKLLSRGMKRLQEILEREGV